MFQVREEDQAVKIRQMSTAYEELEVKYQDLETTTKEEYVLMKYKYVNATEEKDNVIASQRAIIEDCDGKCESAEVKRKEYERLIAEHSANKNTTLLSAGPCYSRIIKYSKLDEMFRNKPKKKGSSKNVQILSCDNTACDGVNVDLIRCNICTTYVCEECNVVPIANLKSVVEKCS